MFGAKGLDKGAFLTAQQAGIEVGADGLFFPCRVVALVGEVDQGVEHDQQQGDKRRTFPVQGVFGG